MTNNQTTGLREMLNRLIREFDRLDIALDAPASDMTLGEYEQAREKLLDGFVQAIAATLGNEREKALEELVQDVWAVYSAKAESSFHPAWEVDSELARRMAAFGFEVIDE